MVLNKKVVFCKINNILMVRRETKEGLLKLCDGAIKNDELKNKIIKLEHKKLLPSETFLRTQH